MIGNAEIENFHDTWMIQSTCRSCFILKRNELLRADIAKSFHRHFFAQERIATEINFASRPASENADRLKST